jgi:hypothetical protein
MTGSRFAAALALVLQLSPLASPALCRVAERSRTPCHETRMPGASQLVAPGVSQHVPCADGAICGPSVTGIPETAITLTAPAAQRVTPPGASSLHAGDPIPPLSPPPQA